MNPRTEDRIILTALCLASVLVFVLTLLLAPDAVPRTPPTPTCSELAIPFRPGSNYLGGTEQRWYGPDGRAYGYSTHEDSAIYPTHEQAQACTNKGN